MKKLVGYYDYTVILTYTGMLLAFAGICAVLNGAYSISLICLMMAGVCDMFDGAVANTKNRSTDERQFGIQIDSMCDLISFGLLPALFVYVISGKLVYVAVIAACFTLCGLIRLSYYNVQESKRQLENQGDREFFLGLPITSSAMILPMAYLVYTFVPGVPAILFSIVLAVVAMCYIAGFKMKKPQKLGKLILIIIGLAELVGVIITL